MNIENEDDWPSDEEIAHLYEIVTHEEAQRERALDLIEHERLDASALSHFNGGYMAEQNNSRVIVSDLTGSAICKNHERGTVVQLHGYGYTHRKPSFSISEHTVSLYVSVEEARDLASKLLDFLEQKEKAS